MLYQQLRKHTQTREVWFKQLENFSTPSLLNSILRCDRLMCVRAHLVFAWNSWRSLVWHNEQALPASPLIYAWHWPVNQTRDTFTPSTANWFFIIHFRLSDRLWESLKDPCVLSWIFDAIWCFLSSPSLSSPFDVIFFCSENVTWAESFAMRVSG